jgi:hypothetical protein
LPKVLFFCSAPRDAALQLFCCMEQGTPRYMTTVKCALPKEKNSKSAERNDWKLGAIAYRHPVELDGDGCI